MTVRVAEADKFPRAAATLNRRMSNTRVGGDLLVALADVGRRPTSTSFPLKETLRGCLWLGQELVEAASDALTF